MLDKQEQQKFKATSEALKTLESAKDFKFHKQTGQEVLDHFKSTLAKGLSEKEVKARQQQYGLNELDKEEEGSLWESIKEQFEDPLARILLASATISFAIALTGGTDEGITAYVEPFVILLILILNALVAIYQDKDADSALEALKDMQAVECHVKRDGEWVLRDSNQLVPGDIVKVKMGDKIPADVRLVELNSVSFLVEEAPLTGEAISVHKTTDVMQGATDLLLDQHNMIFSSTLVNYGSATGVVVFTGMRTAIGRVQKQVEEASEKEEDTPLKVQLDKFGENLTYLIGAVCLLVWLMNFNNFFDEVHGSWIKGCIYYFKIAIALAVAAIPEGLPAVITTCLALGTRKMAKNNAIVRKLPSVQTLGCTTVICSDKTGTLTKNQMAVVKFGLLEEDSSSMKEFTVSEPSASKIPTGFANKNISSYCTLGSSVSNTSGFEEAVKAIGVGCVLNNGSEIFLEDGKSGKEFKKVGEPTDAALKVFAQKLSGDGSSAFNYIQEIEKKIKIVAKLDFTSVRKCMSTVVSNYKGGLDTLIKGAPDRVLKKCTQYLTKSGVKEMTAADSKQLEKHIAHFSSQGLRCLAIAEIPGAGSLAGLTENNMTDLLKDTQKYNDYEQGAIFLGLVCIKDPVRAEVKKSIQDCYTAGIRVIMITGDSKETATAVAKELNIIEAGDDEAKCVFTGDQFEEMTDAERIKALSGQGGRVFSRVEPAHKRQLVKHLEEMNEVVAMTGDGVNDAPALKQAHIGIAMGITGTEVAKNASDMVLADDNFATIVKAVEEGRSIYSNMKAFIRYLISSNIGEVLSIFMTALLGIPEGFTSVQLLWVNLVTDGPPATALGFNPPDVDIMKKPPRKRNEDLLSKWVLIRYCVIGFYVGLATVGIFVYWYVFAETGDDHTLVTFQQLSHWGDCPSWSKEEFSPVNFIEGMDFTANPCTYFTNGKIKASTLSLTVLVVIEMLNALNAISEDNSLLTMSPFVNPFLLLAIAGSIGLHYMILYVPWFATIFGIAPLNFKEWIIVYAFSVPVIFVDEVLKIFGRQFNEAELKARLAKKKSQ